MKAHLRIGCALVVLASGLAPSAIAGWTGQMNGTGYGRAGVNVTAGADGTLIGANLAFAKVGPSAAMSPFGNYDAMAFLPPRASGATYARVKGGAGYVWSCQSYAGAGDRTDNLEIQSRMTINPADCAEISIDTAAVFNPGEKSGVIQITGFATHGTAMLLRGYELLNGTGQEEQDPTLDELKQNGVLRFEVLVAGPFNFETGCAMLVPWAIETTKENLFVISDGVALSKEFSIKCPNNVDFACGPVSYSAETKGGCGIVDVVYDPPAAALPVGTTVVNVTATDEAGNVVGCSFTAKRATDPFSINCQSLVDFACRPLAQLSYPQPQVAGACGQVNFSYSIAATALPIGTTTVIATGTDAFQRTAQCSFTATRRAPEFVGFLFEPPIKDVGGSCNDWKRTVKAGNTLPVKFKATFCTLLPGRTVPTFEVQKCNDLTPVVPSGNFTQVGDEWHFNWSVPKTLQGVVKLIAHLPDGNDQFVFIKVK